MDSGNIVGALDADDIRGLFSWADVRAGDDVAMVKTRIEIDEEALAVTAEVLGTASAIETVNGHP
jgi:chromosome condensin MukBEF MukE localization factor